MSSTYKVSTLKTALLHTVSYIPTVYIQHTKGKVSSKS